jgi:hypothetical protein
LVLRENLSDVDRAQYLIAQERQTVQKLSVIHNLTNLMKEHKDEAIEKILPKILVFLLKVLSNLHSKSIPVKERLICKLLLELHSLA